MSAQAETTCYRHPDRAAGVGCQRCGRPICPQCMVQAAVGFQCPDCTHARPQKAYNSRQLFGSAGTQDVIVGKVLIAINVAVYFLTVANGGSPNAQGEVVAKGITQGGYVAAGEWWRLVSGGFLHANLFHLGMNMFLLWLLAKELEPAVGHVRFALIYGVSLMGGALGVMILTPNSPTLGASGAIFGLMGALVVLQLRAKQNPWNSGLGGLIMINLVITFLNRTEISVGGHIGGLVAGAIAGLLITPLRWPQENARVKDGFLVLIAIGLGVAAVLVAQAFAAPVPVFS